MYYICLTPTINVYTHSLSFKFIVLDGSNTAYTIFMIIGIIGYFTIPTVAGWIIQAGGMGSYNRSINNTAMTGGSWAGSIAGGVAGNVAGRAGKLLK